MSETSMSQRLEEIQKIISIFSSTNLVEMELESTGFSLKVKKAVGAGATGESSAIKSTVIPEVSSLVKRLALPAAPAKDDASVKILKSGMNGNFFRAAAPGETPFVKVGDKVDIGQRLCLIEAMKMLNEVDSDWAGTVKEILGEEGSVVSVGTPLFAIEVNGDV